MTIGYSVNRHPSSVTCATSNERRSVLKFAQQAIALKKLDSPNEEVRARACYDLGRVGGAKAVKPLMDRLGDKISDVRAVASEALGRIKDPKAIPVLMRRL